MVFIHTRFEDYTTVVFIQWLQYYKKEYFRLNSIEDMYNCLSFDFQSDLPTISWNNHYGEKLTLHDIQSYYFNGGNYFSISEKTDSPNLTRQINNYLSDEVKSIVSALVFKDDKKMFGQPSFLVPKYNKLSTLLLAQKIGLNIPESKIITSKTDLINLKRIWPRIINKGIENGINIHTNEYIIDGQRTEEITEDVISRMDNEFAPSLIQKLVEKQFEIRAFVYGNMVYSIAILSQDNKHTEIDWRNSGNQIINRELPFKLPDDIETRIIHLVEQLGLNYASIDLIYDKCGKFIFLEANPYGQYGFVSSSGNYFIERKIAKELH